MSFRAALRITPEFLAQREAKRAAQAKKSEFFRNRAAHQQATTPVQDLCELIYRTTGVWSAEHTNMIAKIHQLAHEQGNAMVDNIAHNLMHSHMVSPAQASVLGRFAIANNITL